MPGYLPGMVIGNVGSMQEESDISAQERQRIAERARTGIELRQNLAQGIPNSGGFDASDLMAAPEERQRSTRDQAEKVSAPYRDANMMAAEKTNPMNAASQEPGRVFLMRFIGK